MRFCYLLYTILNTITVVLYVGLVYAAVAERGRKVHTLLSNVRGEAEQSADVNSTSPIYSMIISS